MGREQDGGRTVEEGASIFDVVGPSLVACRKRNHLASFLWPDLNSHRQTSLHITWSCSCEIQFVRPRFIININSEFWI